MAGNPLQNAHGVVVSRNGSVYTTGYDSNFLGFVSHFFAGPTGKLSYDGCVSNDGTGGRCADIPGSGTPLQSPSGLAVSPNGGSVYVTSLSSSTLSHFFADTSAGQLKWDSCVSNDGSGGSCIKGPSGPGSPLGFPTGVAVSPLASAPNGSVYFTSLGSTSLLSVDGTLGHVFADPMGGQMTWDGCLSNDGSSGTCAPLPGTPPALTGPLSLPNALAVNPAGTAVYVTAGQYGGLDIGQGTILQFSAAATSGGQITKLVGCLSDTGTNGCAKVSAIGTPLANAGAVAVSPDGASVYVASGVGVDHFFADPKGTGLLSLDGCVSDDGSGGACTKGPQSGTPLSGADAVAVSPDGRSVYVTSAAALSWFSVAPQGQLTFQGCISDAAVPGCIAAPAKSLSGADAVTVSPDGGSVYVASAEGITHLFRAQPAGAGTGGNGGGGSGGGSGTGTGASTLSSLAISPHAFRAAPSGPSVIVKPSSRKGGKVTFQLDAAATVNFAIQHLVPGRRQRVNGKTRCVARTHANAHAQSCARLVTAGTFSQAGTAGSNSVRFSGRLDGHKLLAGKYTLTATPAAGGITGHAVTTTFSIKH